MRLSQQIEVHFLAFAFVSAYNAGIAFLVKYFRQGMSYLGSSVYSIRRNPSFLSTLYGQRSLQIKQATDLVILAALGDVE